MIYGAHATLKKGILNAEEFIEFYITLGRHLKKARKLDGLEHRVQMISKRQILTNVLSVLRSLVDYKEVVIGKKKKKDPTGVHLMPIVIWALKQHRMPKKGQEILIYIGSYF